MGPTGDTICARATPPGRGGVAVIRVSGPEVAALAAPLLGGPLPAPRYAALRRFLDADGTTLDEGLVLHFPAPHSFTGEEVLELQGHGGDVVVARLLRRLNNLGVRSARPGEFSERAFLNGRMDLTRAEAIADLIDARSEAAARAAMRSLAGAFADSVTALTDALTELRAYVEAAIDFPDEEIDFLADGAVASRLASLRATLAETLRQAQQGRALRDGMTVVIAGRPNAGKSSLLNRLAGVEAAIVTDIPGTTRDALREQLVVDGMPLQVIDTAGLRDGADAIEAEGIRRARQAMADSDRVLVIVDDTEEPAATARRLLADCPPGVAVTVIHNKIDRTGREPGPVPGSEPPAVAVSALTGQGMAALRHHLAGLMGLADGGGDFSARQRHVTALETAGGHVDRAAAHLDTGAGELMAEELALAQDALGTITGAVTSEDLLGHIFASFCIGK